MGVITIKFKLDFNIYSAKDRLESIKKIDLKNLNPTELETISNYILYGKDEDGTSIVDRKEVQIKTRFNSYQKDRIISLDEMMESPTFDESVLSKERQIYKRPKPSIDRERAAQIPGMEELWEEISKFDHILKQNQGKENFQEGTPKLSSRQQYFLNHYLIQLRTQQYYLWDSYYPTQGTHINKAEFKPNPADFHFNYRVFPRGVMRIEKDKIFQNPRENTKLELWEIGTDKELQELKAAGKPFFDFREESHLYYLIQFYEELQFYIEDFPDSIINNLLWTLDFYIEKAKLSDQQLFIVECKKKRMQNREIAKALEKKLGIKHQENYISTIWNKSVKLIQDAVELNFDEFICRKVDKAWKKCSCCGKELFRDNRNFVKKVKASDGLASRCKFCDKMIRQGIDPKKNQPKENLAKN